jgi:hypothetical protein
MSSPFQDPTAVEFGLLGPVSLVITDAASFCCGEPADREYVRFGSANV